MRKDGKGENVIIELKEVGKMGKKRNFVVEKGSYKGHVFTGRTPRQAALKLANRGITHIVIRETGTKTLHIYRGSRKKVKAPKNAPEWLGNTVYKANVRKIRTEKIR